MNDAPAEVEARLRAMLAARSGSDRVRMACEMFMLARTLMVADIRRTDPALDGADLRIRILERTYGNELDEATIARIAGRWRA